MKTHNAVIFHCQVCGNISHCERNAEPPTCCGCEMVRAAGETICDENENGRLMEELPHARKRNPAVGNKLR